jgi:FkbM family methyltransferase
MGKMRRDEFLKRTRMSEFDFLPERVYLAKNGVKVIPRQGTRDFQMLLIPREDEVKQFLCLEGNEAFVDIGANVGLYSLNAAREFKDKAVQVIAIEAHPDNFKALCRNILCNSFEEIITPVNKAVSDHHGKVTLFERSHDGARVDSELYSLCNSPNIDGFNILHPEGKTLEVECDTLDNIVKDRRVDVIKIDVEGAEVQVLKGAKQTLDRIRKIVIEIHGDNSEQVKQELSQYGFELATLKEHSKMTYVTGTK